MPQETHVAPELAHVTAELAAAPPPAVPPGSSSFTEARNHYISTHPVLAHLRSQGVERMGLDGPPPRVFFSATVSGTDYYPPGDLGNM